MKPFISMRGVDAWVAAVQSAGDSAEAEVTVALEDAIEMMRKSVDFHVWPAKVKNIQDTNKPGSVGRRKPITTRVFGNQAEIELRSYWARARSGTVQGVMKKIGRGEDLIRNSLWINPRGAKSSGSDSARFKILFQKAPRLRNWAGQGQSPRTWQFHRHSLRLPVEALGPLAMYPALGKKGSAISARLAMVADRFVEDATS